MIWIIGGTINATDICKLLITQELPVLVSVTTDYGKNLAQQTGAEVILAILTPSDMRQLIKTRNVKLIIDASHPYAVEVSENAMKVATETNIPYLRFERHNKQFEGVKYLSNYQAVVEYLSLTSGKILLTTGSKHIASFTSLGVERLIARVLSTSTSMALCEEAGLKPSQIIGLSGKYSTKLNLSILQEFDIKYLVTKESGTEGGIDEKIEAAKRSDVDVIIIKRPEIPYPEKFEEYFSLMQRVKEVIDVEIQFN